METLLPQPEQVFTASSDILATDWGSITPALDGCILSASGWRKIFAQSGNEESKEYRLKPRDYALAAFMAEAYIACMFPDGLEDGKILAIGTDSRPTGPLIAESMIRACLGRGYGIAFCGVVTAPQIMAWARLDSRIAGFIYISASHNPIGHNGVKFGLKTGGVLSGSQIKPLIERLKHNMTLQGAGDRERILLSAVPGAELRKAWNQQEGFLENSASSYLEHTAEVIASSPEAAVQKKIVHGLKKALQTHSLGIVVDFNGSARCTSIDCSFLGDLGIHVHAINNIAGDIAHRIVPEGESLEFCRMELERMWQQDPRFVLGYMPDNDGDRGNLVYMKKSIGKAAILEAQEVFALACMSELGNAFTLPGNKTTKKIGVAVNDPTSLRIEALAEAFDAQVFRAEVGEANVVQLAEEKRKDGWLIPILGEGSNGGSIVYPSAVRDPLNTVLGILRLLSSRQEESAPFALWCRYKNIQFKNDFTLEDIVNTLPCYTTTSVYEDRALMKIRSMNHGKLKALYEALFVEEWEVKKDWLGARFGISSWECLNYEGTVTRSGMGKNSRTGEERGGFKIQFTSSRGKPVAYLWMRGSGTEPVFRILVDLAGNDPEGEKLLLDWHRALVSRADAACS